MNLIHAIRRLAGILAGLATAALASTAAPAALASTPPGRAWLPSWADPPLPPGWNTHPPLPVHVHAAATGGIPGWQATLIAIGVALLVATMAVLAGRAWAARRKPAKGAASVRHASSGPAPTPAPPVR